VVEFLRQGLARGQQALYVQVTPDGHPAAELAALGDLAALQADGRLVISRLAERYLSRAGVPPGELCAVYAEAIEQALSDGFAGLCVAADATPLVSTPQQREWFVRHEHLADRLAARRPFAALCGFRADQLDSDTVARLAAVHPRCRGCTVPFHVAATGGPVIRLSGDVDITCLVLFEHTLDALPAAGGPLHIEASGLEFVDHRGLLALDAWAGRSGTTVRLDAAPSVVAGLVRLLRLQRVTADTA
jgi:hypothetical protein